MKTKTIKKFKYLFFFFIITSILHAQCWTSIETGFSHTLAIKNDGTLWSWGRMFGSGSSNQGALGLGSDIYSVCIPTQIGNESNWVKISAANHYSLGIKSDGTLWSWGHKNGYGSIGIMSSNNISIPTQVGTDNNWKEISAGQFLAMAIKTDGTLWGWSGSVPNGIPLSGISQITPMQLGNENDWKEISCGYDHNLALKNNNTLWSNGKNFNGQLGNGNSGTSLEQNAFIQIGNETNWKSISAGYRFSLAIKNNGTLWGWGKNNYNQLGDGTSIQKVLPIQIGNQVDWLKITAGYENGFGIKTNNSLWGWGRNNLAQLGLGNTVQNNVPAQIGTNYNLIVSDQSHSLAIKNDFSLWGCGNNFLGGLGLTNGTFAVNNNYVLNFAQVKCQPAFVANDDVYTTIIGSSNISIGNVRINDYTYGNLANNSNTKLNFISSTNNGITLNTTTGAININSSVPIGIYTLVYNICNTNEVYCEYCGDEGIVTIHVNNCNLSPTFDLIVKDSSDDTGIEPNTVTPYMWTSDNIWVRNYNDNGLEHQNPDYSATGNANFVKVRVINNSCITSLGNEQLKLYWAKASTALSYPNPWMGGITYAPTGASMGSPIGTLNIPVLQPGEETILTFPWIVPNPNDYGTDGDQWHFCLLTRISAANDPMTSTETTDLNANVRNNNNIAWKNVTVVDVLPNNTVNPGGIIAVGNPFNHPKTFFLEMEISDLETGKPIYEEAEIGIKMDDVLYNAWVRGGKEAQLLDSTIEEKRKIVTGNKVILDNLSFNANEIGTLRLDFNFLTKELTDKTNYAYHVIQKDSENGNIIGGETFIINKTPRESFEANTNNDLEVDLNQSITISADDINEPAIYNWYDNEGNLIYQGKDLEVANAVSEKYKLEVISTVDGFKDYVEVEVKIKPSTLETISPNPVQNNVKIGYKLNTNDSAYLMILGYYGSNGISNNYILDVNSNEIDINVSNYPSGFYTVALIINGNIIDAKTLIKQ